VSIAFLFIGGLVGLTGSLFLHWHIVTKILTIPAPNGLPGQDEGEDGPLPHNNQEA
jgi:hypothetical protein